MHMARWLPLCGITGFGITDAAIILPSILPSGLPSVLPSGFILEQMEVMFQLDADVIRLFAFLISHLGGMEEMAVTKIDWSYHRPG